MIFLIHYAHLFLTHATELPQRRYPTITHGMHAPCQVSASSMEGGRGGGVGEGGGDCNFQGLKVCPPHETHTSHHRTASNLVHSHHILYESAMSSLVVIGGGGGTLTGEACLGNFGPNAQQSWVYMWFAAEPLTSPPSNCLKPCVHTHNITWECPVEFDDGWWWGWPSYTSDLPSLPLA